MALYKDGYEDILEERRHKSDLKYSMRTRRDVPKYKYTKPRTPEELKKHVFESDRVKYTVEKVSRLNVCLNLRNFFLSLPAKLNLCIKTSMKKSTS